MNRVVLVFVYCLLSANICYTQVAESDIISKFFEYRSFAVTAGYPGNEEEIRDKARKMAARLKNELFRNSEETISALLSVLDNPMSSRGQKVDVINFFAAEQIGREELLPIIRNYVKGADLENDPDPILSACATYLYDFGGISDIELLERLKGHINPAFARLASYGIGEIQERTTHLNGSSSLFENGKSTAENGASSNTGKPQVKGEVGSRNWVSVAVALLLVVVVILALFHFCRKIFRNFQGQVVY